MKAKQRYLEQKYNATKRGIPFLFSFEEWVAWWEAHLGPDWLSRRGCFVGGYVMARKKDKGGYQKSNVQCLLHQKNARDIKKNNSIASGSFAGNALLTDTAVLDIFLSNEPYAVLQQRYQISVGAINDIRSGRTWRRVTKGLARKTTRGRNQWQG